MVRAAINQRAIQRAILVMSGTRQQRAESSRLDRLINNYRRRSILQFSQEVSHYAYHFARSARCR